MNSPQKTFGMIAAAGRVLALAMTFAASISLRAQPLAFPGAEGYGRFSTGGRGGVVYHVTNLNDSGPGSLRAAVISAGPRTVVFDVSGTIYLSSTLRITNGNLTIAGQTAPGDGICLANYPIDPSNSSNVIIRFIRSRLGDGADLENDAFSCRYATDVIVDHCSFSWSIDETATAYDNTRFTMQWCFVTESLRDSVHNKGAHGYGGIWGGLGATFHHNLLAHHDSRNPRFGGARYHGTDGEYCDVRNNVIYNWKGNSCYGGEPTDAGIPSHQNLINNYYKPGPATGTGSIRYRILNPSANALSTGSLYGLFHVAGNVAAASSTVTADNWAGGVQGPTAAQLTAMRADTPFTVAPVSTQTATAAYSFVLAYAGCRLPARDSVDARVASEVSNGTVTYYGSKNGYPGIIDSQTDVGGYPVLNSLAAPTDTDQDGMPDAWETAQGLNPADASDRNLTNTESYTKLEVYLNSLAAPAFPLPSISTQPASAMVALGSALNLSVAATGTGTLAYQWYKNGNALAGATNSSYTVASTSSGDVGTYQVIVTGDYGSTSSATATVTITVSPPAITTQPAALELTVGQAASFSVAATGSAPLSYQWYRGAGQLIAGATSATYPIAAVALSDAASYYVVVTNPNGSTTSAAAALSVNAFSAGYVFSTDFSTNTIHAVSPLLTASTTNWYVMSAKNATTSSVGDDPATNGVIETRPLDLTMPLTTSGIVESAAFFAASPKTLAALGDVLRARMVFRPTNVKNVGLGLFKSGGVPPYTGLINSQLISTSTTFATGGTQNWLGYRAVVTTATATANLEARPAQNGLSNTSQTLIVPGTGSSAPTIISIGSIPASAGSVTFTDGQTYTLTVTLTRASETAFTLACTVHAGTDTAAAALFSTSATTTTAGTLPADVTNAFDALGIGYRNAGGASVSHLTVTSLRVDYEPVPVPDAYSALIAASGLSLAGNGALTADPDGDGVPNALEFIQGGNPSSSDSRPHPACVAESDTTVAFSFARHLDATSLFTLTVEQSADLTTWNLLTEGSGGVTMTTAPLDPDHELVTVRAPLSPPRTFYRLRATSR